MERLGTAWKGGLRLLLAAVAISALAFLAPAVERYLRGQDRSLAQELTIHHFERSSWFAMNAGKYEGIDPELTRRFREVAAWHARRAREFQRMDPGEVAGESERDFEHDRSEGPLLVRALKYDSILGKRGSEATGKAEGNGGGESRTAPP